MGESTPLRRSLDIARRAKLPRVPSSEAADHAQALIAEGKDVIILKGAPFWAPPGHVIEAATRAAQSNRQPPSSGFPGLRRAIAGRLEEQDGIFFDPSTEILVTAGAMHALDVVFKTLLDPGDEAVIFSPSFFFFGLIELAGAVPVYARTREEDDWQWTPEALEAVITPRTKAIVVSSPANPTGFVAGEEDLRAIVEVAARHDLYVVSDECYDNMLYDGARHVRFASVAEDRDRIVTICSFTKTFALQPWRLGFIAAAPRLIRYMRKILEWGVLKCGHVAQRAGQAAIEGPQEWIDEISPRYQRSRDLMLAGLEPASGLSCVVPRGAPFLFVNTSGLGVTGAEFARKLLFDWGVLAEPGDLFGSENHIRLLFGGTDEEVTGAARRICAAAAEG